MLGVPSAAARPATCLLLQVLPVGTAEAGGCPVKAAAATAVVVVVDCCLDPTIRLQAGRGMHRGMEGRSSGGERGAVGTSPALESVAAAAAAGSTGCCAVAAAVCSGAAVGSTNADGDGGSKQSKENGSSAAVAIGCSSPVAAVACRFGRSSASADGNMAVRGDAASNGAAGAVCSPFLHYRTTQQQQVNRAFSHPIVRGCLRASALVTYMRVNRTSGHPR